MGCVCGDLLSSNTKETQAKQETVALLKGEKTLHLAFNEICTSNTKFQYTLVTTKSNKNGSVISKSKNLIMKDLYNVGDRISDVTKLTANNEFYALIRRFEENKIDENEIQKYKLTKNTDSDNKINIEFVEIVFKGLDKNEGINMEGIEVIESDDNKLIGFLECNDYFSKPPNSNLYFLNLKGENKILYSFDDDGYSELDGIVEFKGYNKNGYLLLSQFLGLGRKAIFKDKNIKKYIEWSLENNENAFMYFVNKNDVLKLIECDDDDEKKENELKMEKVYVGLNDNYKSDKSLFVQYKDCENEGFEAVSIDNNNNVLFSIEYTKYENTFNCIVVGRIFKNNDANLEIIIDPCKYVVVSNNGGAKNHAQESLLYVSM